MVDDKTVFGWVRVYFTGKTKKIEPVQATVTVSQENTKVIPKKIKNQKVWLRANLTYLVRLYEEKPKDYRRSFKAT
ncbi:hypothetical protein HMPREF1234_1573 [Streptococcus pyogenes GA41039]|nr:hypothetical protein HMPREF1234_1573 [Streptococcus pyogenes GA41039]